MGLPSKLKNCNLFGDGISFLGMIPEVVLPKLALATEDYRGGGMLGPVPIDMGIEKLEAEFTAGGLLVPAITAFGSTTHDAVQLRFAGAYTNDSGRVQAVEAVLRGRYGEIDLGNAAPGKDTEHKYKLAASYYRLIVDGTDLVEIDLIAPTFIVGGIDRYAEVRAAIGA